MVEELCVSGAGIGAPSDPVRLESTQEAITSEGERNVVAEPSQPHSEMAAAESSKAVDDLLETFRIRMNSAEARERLVAALMAQEFFEEQIRLLRNVRIDDEQGTLVLATALKSPYTAACWTHTRGNA